MKTLSALVLGLFLGKLLASATRPLPAPPTRTVYVNTDPFLLEVQCSKCGTLTTVVTNAHEPRP